MERSPLEHRYWDTAPEGDPAIGDLRRQIQEVKARLRKAARPSKPDRQGRDELRRGPQARP